MAYHIQSSFAAGELDPALQERTTFDKYQAGLAVLRNAYIGKTGRVINRPGHMYDRAPKYDDKKCVIFSPPYTQYIIEWGHLYVRIHNLETGSYSEDSHPLTEDDLPYLQFVPNGLYVYIFNNSGSINMMKMVLGDLDLSDPFLNSRFLSSYRKFYVPVFPSETSRSIGGTGYYVQYAVSLVTADGQESYAGQLPIGTPNSKLPINAGEVNTFVFDCSAESTAASINVYRRPENGIAFGFIGTTSVSGGSATYSDYGSDADYTHNPVEPVDYVDSFDTTSRTGCVYQQRLIRLARLESQSTEALIASRTGYQNNYTRDFPLSDDSSLLFKSGTSNTANVLWMIDNGGLLVFTTAGVFQSTGPLSPSNLALEKKGSWVIDETVRPIEAPGAVFFVDKSTNTIRSLVYSNEAGGFPGDEISIFSNHLFSGKRVVSWAYQDGNTPLIWVIFDDGSLVALTYQREQEMRAWSRHDSQNGQYESVTVVNNSDSSSTVYFVIKRGLKRYIEKTTIRNLEDLKEMVFMDSAVTFNTQIGSDAQINVTAADISDWEGSLTLKSDIDCFDNSADLGAVGSIFRFFDSDGSAVDLEVTAFTSTTEVVVQPSVEFPSDQATDITIYKTFTEFTGLEHLNDQLVSVMSDGYVVSSPLNDIESYPELTVKNGYLALPDGMRGAFVHIGLPYCSDVETLDVDTVEQKPTLLESRLAVRIFLKVLKTRGLYVGSSFPSNDRVKGDNEGEQGMVDPEQQTEDISLGIIGNAAQSPYTKRLHFAVPNDWKSNGKICIRQVDPLPFEILSIIPDLVIER